MRQMRESTAADPIPMADFPAIEALAEHLAVAPQDIVDWIRQSASVPPGVLLGWICAWNRERQAGPASPGSGRADETPAT